MKLLSYLLIFMFIAMIYFDIECLQENRITIPIEKISEQIWDNIPLIQCISLQERNDRYNQASQEFKSVGINNPMFYRPDRHKRGGIVGCATSHIACLKRAQALNVPYTLIFEDDVKFIPGIWHERMISVMKHIQDDDWDMIRIGFIPLDRGKHMDEYIIKGDSITCTGYFISKKAIDRMIPKFDAYYNNTNTDDNKKMNIDEFYKFTSLDDFRLDRTICIQRQSKSDNKWPMDVNKICDTAAYEYIQKSPLIIKTVGLSIGALYYDKKYYKYFYDYDFSNIV